MASCTCNLKIYVKRKRKKVGLETGIRIGAAEFYFDGVHIKQTIDPGAYRKSMHLTTA